MHIRVFMSLWLFKQRKSEILIVLKSFYSLYMIIDSLSPYWMQYKNFLAGKSLPWVKNNFLLNECLNAISAFHKFIKSWKRNYLNFNDNLNFMEILLKKIVLYAIK